ncbi:hypothetical protein [Natrinema sp. 1APR25-10V2]|uniref:hypothetical protein n=1 Tax=Natrinema sp. 1APR25-10V2 TaxID=2951081 RepID=UPI002875302E|nr:hypothetical protein [Natrinema sp. 1APR25-10V2]MDS0474604.1 hypothetical protein [Natrinema sp. 1APR25-10V2]
MIHSVVQMLSIPFVIIASTGAGIFALLLWSIFRNSPFGTAVALLSLGLVVLAVYHVMLFATDLDPMALHVLRSGANTVIAIFLGLLALRHRQLRQDRLTGGKP